LGFRVVQLVPTPSTAMREIFVNHVRLSVDNVLVPVDAVMAALTKLGLDGLDGATPSPNRRTSLPDVHGLTSDRVAVRRLDEPQ
jgi:hypothetical protein